MCQLNNNNHDISVYIVISYKYIVYSSRTLDEKHFGDAKLIDETKVDPYKLDILFRIRSPCKTKQCGAEMHIRKYDCKSPHTRNGHGRTLGIL